MALTIQQQDILRASLERITVQFFRKKSTLITNGPVSMDATGLLVVLSGWVADLIKDAPEDMRDQLFMSFADNVVELAGLREQEPPEHTTPETLQ